MKNLNLTAVVLVMLTICISFNSCKKDETYNPERKIKRIYYNFSDGHKYLAQEWTWDNNKLIRIDYYPMYGSDIFNTEYFIYEESKLVKVQDDNGYYLISYKSSKYDKIEYYRNDDNLLIFNCNFTYKNNKVSKIIFTVYDMWISKMAKDGFITFLFNKDMFSNFEQMVISSTGKSFFPTVSTITYKYNGDNLKEKIWEINESQRITFIYKAYDSMKNPYYKYLGLMNHVSGFRNIEIVASKNNLLESNILDSFVPEYLGINKYSYKYENDYPIEVDAHEMTLYGNYKTYYEYE